MVLLAAASGCCSLCVVHSPHSEEYLEGFTNLECFVSSQPGQKLTLSQSSYILQQLVSVVRSALHQPIQIAHRDIKPENILIHPGSLRIILLDFGLATHFSDRQPKLTTCCGSPAFHAPELFLSLKSPPGSVRYWVSGMGTLASLAVDRLCSV